MGTDTAVGHGDGAVCHIPCDTDHHILPIQGHLVIGQRRICQLVHSIAGIGNDLPEKDLLVGVDGIDHQIQQPLRLGFV